MMKIINEKKDTKYNYHGQPVELGTIPKEELSVALKDFSEGSVILEKCLEVLWWKGLITKACCKGDHLFKGSNMGSDFGEAYIAFEPGIDIFSYLSEDFIKNEYIELDYYGYVDNLAQAIYFYGKDKEQFMVDLIDNVFTGKKENSRLLEQKVGKRAPRHILVESFVHRLEVNDIPEEDILPLIPFIEIIACPSLDIINDENKWNWIISNYEIMLNNCIDKHNLEVVRESTYNPKIRQLGKNIIKRVTFH